jgi:hypothetical protein
VLGREVLHASECVSDLVLADFTAASFERLYADVLARRK